MGKETLEYLELIGEKAREINGSDSVTSENYVPLAVATESNDFEAIRSRMTDKNIRLLHAALGLATEAAEIADALKKHIFYGKDLDERNLIEELGDSEWYIAIGCDALGVDMNKILSDNIVKLYKRYGSSFSSKKAIDRDVDNELSHI